MGLNLKMLPSQMHVLLVVLFPSVLLLHVSCVPQRHMETEAIRAELMNDEVSHRYASTLRGSTN